MKKTLKTWNFKKKKKEEEKHRNEERTMSSNRKKIKKEDKNELARGFLSFYSKASLISRIKGLESQDNNQCLPLATAEDGDKCQKNTNHIIKTNKSKANTLKLSQYYYSFLLQHKHKFYFMIHVIEMPCYLRLGSSGQKCWITLLKQRKQHSLYEICFWNFEIYLVSWSNLDVTVIQTVPLKSL